MLKQVIEGDANLYTDEQVVSYFLDLTEKYGHLGRVELIYLRGHYTFSYFKYED